MYDGVPCKLWTGSTSRKGYGRAMRDGRSVLIHRHAYEEEHGPIPKPLEIDHLCRNRACYELSHLEVVTHRENVRRAPRMGPVPTPPCTGKHTLRGCVACNREYQREWMRQRRTEKTMPRQKNTGVGTMTTATNFDTRVRDGFREQIKTALHDAIDAGDYDLVGALTEFGKRVDNLRSPRGESSGPMNQGGNNTQTSGINQGADVEPVVAGPADGEAP